MAAGCVDRSALAARAIVSRLVHPGIPALSQRLCCRGLDEHPEKITDHGQDLAKHPLSSFPRSSKGHENLRDQDPCAAHQAPFRCKTAGSDLLCGAFQNATPMALLQRDRFDR